MLEKSMKILSYLTAFALTALVVLILYDATARYLFFGGSTALQELEWHLFDVVVMLSIAYALKHNAHVRVDIFYERFAPKTQLLIDIIAILFFILPFSIFIIYISLGFVEMSYLQNEASCDPGGLSHRWIIKSLMPLAFLFLSLSAIERVIALFREWRAL